MTDRADAVAKAVVEELYPPLDRVIDRYVCEAIVHGGLCYDTDAAINEAVRSYMQPDLVACRARIAAALIRGYTITHPSTLMQQRQTMRLTAKHIGDAVTRIRDAATQTAGEMEAALTAVLVTDRKERL